MTYERLALSDIQMLDVLRVARETGALVMVHAENYDAIRFLTDRLERAGNTHRNFTRRRGRSRSSAKQRTAPSALSEIVDVPIMIVHVSNGEAMR